MTLELFANYIAHDSSRYAHLFASKVFNSVLRLEDFPMSGRIVPEIEQEDIREIILGNYRIIYRISGENVYILTVYHSARLFDPSQIKKIYKE